MKESEQLLTSFITPFGSFYYVLMLFELKMYQRCMLRCFGDLIGRTIEAYVDNIVVKSKQAEHLVADLEQTFAKLWANSIKLNPEKCVFWVPRGMLLGFIISERGIEANPEKISAITKMGPIQNIKGFSESLDALPPSADSFRASANEDFPFIDSRNPTTLSGQPRLRRRLTRLNNS